MNPRLGRGLILVSVRGSSLAALDPWTCLDAGSDLHDSLLVLFWRFGDEPLLASAGGLDLRTCLDAAVDLHGLLLCGSVY
jgi:hypothetical protein